jgi:hypothetical protein
MQTCLMYGFCTSCPPSQSFYPIIEARAANYPDDCSSFCVDNRASTGSWSRYLCDEHVYQVIVCPWLIVWL